MSLGEAFIDIRARTAGFKQQLRDLQPELDALQAKTNAALAGTSTGNRAKGGGAGPAAAAQESIAKASRAATDAQISDLERLKAARAAASDEEKAAFKRASDAESAFRKAEFNSTLRAEQTLTDAEIASAKASLPALKAVAAERAAQEEEARKARRALDRQVEAETIRASRTVANAEIADIERVRAAAAKAARVAPGNALEVSGLQRARDQLAKALSESTRADIAAANAAASGLASEAKAAAAVADKARKAAFDAQRELTAVRAKTFADVGSTPAIRSAADRAAKAVADRAKKPTGVGTPLSVFDAGPLDKAQAAARAAAGKITKAFQDQAAKVAAAEQKAFNSVGASAEKAGARAAAAARKSADAQIAEARRVEAATAKAAASRAAATGKGVNNATAAQLERDLAAQRAAQAATNAARLASDRETNDAIAESRRVLNRTEGLLHDLDLAAARASDAERVASARAANAAIAEAAKAQKNSAAGQLSSAIGGQLKSIPGDIFGAVTTSAKFATIGVLGLGAALTGIGLVTAAKQQAALVSFTAFADKIVGSKAAVDAYKQSIDDLSVGLSKEQSVGRDFLQQLIQIANTSALSQTALQDTSQQLLALGFNGDKTVGIIKDIGNALAASGKTGGGLNDDLKGIVVAFSQIKGAGRLLAQDLNQITTRIPAATRIDVYRELGKNLKLAGANAKEGTKAFADFLKVLQKKTKGGEIGSDLAIASITKVLEQVPGAARDAKTGLDALQRQNLTLGGSFEALKDNIRNSLAQAFLPIKGPNQKDNPATNLAASIQKAIPAVNAAITKLGVPLAKFTSSFADLLFKGLPPLAALIGKTFGGIANALDSLRSNLDSITAAFKSFRDILSKVGFGPALLEAFKAIREAIPPIIAAIAGIVVGLSPVLSIVADIARVVVTVLTPVFKGAALAFGAIGVALAPVAEVVRKLTDQFVKLFGNDIIQKVGLVVGAFAGLTLAVAATDLAIKTLTISMAKMSGAIVRFVLPALNLMAAALAEVVFFLAVNPIVLATLAIAALGAAFYLAWQNSSLFQTVIVDIAKAILLFPLAPLLLLAQGFKLLFEGLIAIQPVVNVLFQIAEALALLTGIPELIGFIAKSFDDIKGAVESAGSAIATAFGATVAFFQNIGSIIADVATNIGGVIEKIGSKIADVATFIGGFVLDAIGKLSFFGPAFDAIGSAASALGGVFSTVFGAIGDVISTIAGAIKGFLGHLADVAHFVGKLPKIPDYSGPLRDAANSMDSLTGAAFGAVNQLDAVKGGLTSINGAVAVASVVIDIRTNNPFAASTNGELPGSLPIEGGPQAVAVKSIGQQLEDALSKFDKIGSGATGSTASKAADKAAQVATTFKQALKDILAGLDKDFRDTLVNGTRKQIDTALDSLSKKIAAAFKAAGKQRPNRLLDDIAADNVKLKNLADQRDKLLEKIKAATDRFNAVRTQIKDFASVSSIDLASIGLAAKDATTKLADLSKLRIVLPGQDALNIISGGSAIDLAKGAQRFSDALAARLKQITDFQANVQKLIKEGLNKTTIDQIISQGPEAGGVLAQSLAGASKQTIDQINATQKGIDAAATKLANTAVDSLFRSGEAVVDGLLAGLTKKEKEIVAAMKHIADVLVTEIKKRLKIASPSRRLAAEVGQHIIPGLLAPIHADGHGLVREAMTSIADTMAAHAPTLAPIDLDVLGGMAAVQARLQLDAALAPSTVQLLAPPPPDAQRLMLGRDGVSAIVDALAAARASKEIHAPITVHAPAAIADPHATAKVLARAIRGIR